MSQWVSGSVGQWVRLGPSGSIWVWVCLGPSGSLTDSVFLVCAGGGGLAVRRLGCGHAGGRDALYGVSWPRLTMLFRLLVLALLS